ncbi:uncharacterized protein LOC108671759 [Hyalella azteca]|uniref:Small ribosomal subunit protein mS40 n=1 Tax=Hyalella azteca TaxID=294128 RepID=A0A8B7NNV2_HYAAZ|nr:uncharacterized protein LOC108671759 [Hyalella azteca]
MAFVTRISWRLPIRLSSDCKLPPVLHRAHSKNLHSCSSSCSSVELPNQTQVIRTPHVQLVTRQLNFQGRRLQSLRLISSSTCLRQESDEENGGEEEKPEGRPVLDLVDGVRLAVRNHKVLEIPVDVSIRYMKSEAYKSTYGDEPVWKKYRRNNPGQYFDLTRPACILGGVLARASACPICRDDYLVVDYRNVELLKQFISPQSGQQYFMKKTCVCQRAFRYLEVAIERAKDMGLLVHDVPIRRYDYRNFYPPELLQSNYTYVEQ